MAGNEAERDIEALLEERRTFEPSEDFESAAWFPANSTLHRAIM